MRASVFAPPLDVRTSFSSLVRRALLGGQGFMPVNDSTLACASSMQCVLLELGAMLRGTNSAFCYNSTGTSLCIRLVQLLLYAFLSLSVLVIAVQTGELEWLCCHCRDTHIHDHARSPMHHARGKRLLCVYWCPSRSISIVYTINSLHHHLLAPILSLDEHCSEVRLETPTGFFPVVTTLFSFPDGDSCYGLWSTVYGI